MVTALLLSGGTGARMGGETPKQYLKVNGRPIISYCLGTLLAHPRIDALQIVADPLWREEILQCMEKSCGAGAEDERREAAASAFGGNDKFRGFSAPGENRQLSILNGLEDIGRYAGEQDIVLIHDAARPLLAAKQITGCLEALAGHEGVLPALPMKDTVYYTQDGKTIGQLLDRSRVIAGQAPEAFVLGPYLEANRALLPERILSVNGSTEPAIMAGLRVALIPGDEGNFKITTQADLERFRELASH